MTEMSERLVKGLTSQLDHVIRNGDEHQTYPGLPPELPQTVLCHCLLQAASTSPSPTWRERVC